MARMISGLLARGMSVSSLLLWHHVEIGLGLPEHARDRGTGLQALEVSRHVFVVIAERLHHVAIEQGGQRGAIDEAECWTHCPAAVSHLRLDHPIGGAQLRS